MSKLLSHPQAVCNILRRIAHEAGEITLDYFEEGMTVATDSKDDGSPVTEADKRAEAYILKELRDQFPDVPMVAEECMSQGVCPDLKGHEYFFLIDPLDGTRGFAAGSKDYTVNIGLIKNGAPYQGVIYAPAHGEMFSTDGEGGAIRWAEDSGSEKSIRVRRPSKGGLVVMASKNRAHAEVDKYLEEQKVEKIIRRGSSLKICAVAMGKADLYTGFGETCEWDTAAGHAILQAAGGDIVTLEGIPLSYGHVERKFINPSFLARSKHLAP
jgi:3'(2'), 5'-bisphosphate nucleotidase